MDSEYNEKVYKAWSELGRGLFTGGLFPGAAAGGQNPLYESWIRDLQGLFDKMTALPPASLVGGTTGLDPKAYSWYVDLVKAQARLYENWTSTMADFSKAWVEGTTSAAKKLSSVKFETPEAYRKKSYELFIKELESKFDALVRDEKFSSRLGDLVSSILEIKQKSDGLFATYQGLLNIPTRTEIDQVYKELHELKRAVRKLSRDSGGLVEVVTDE